MRSTPRTSSRGYALDKDTFIEVTKEELENVVASESTRTIDIDEFVDRSEIDLRYLSCSV